MIEREGPGEMGVSHGARRLDEVDEREDTPLGAPEQDLAVRRLVLRYGLSLPVALIVAAAAGLGKRAP